MSDEQTMDMSASRRGAAPQGSDVAEIEEALWAGVEDSVGAGAHLAPDAPERLLRRLDEYGYEVRTRSNVSRRKQAITAGDIAAQAIRDDVRLNGPLYPTVTDEGTRSAGRAVIEALEGAGWTLTPPAPVQANADSSARKTEAEGLPNPEGGGLRE